MNRCTVSDIERLVGEIAPFELAEEWDNVGLLFGCRNAEVTRVVVALDLTQTAVDQGEGAGRAADCDAPPDHVQRRQAGDGRDARGQADARHGAAPASAILRRTRNLDAAQGGVNDTLMRVMGAENVRGEGFVRAGDVAEGTTFGQLCARAQKKLHASRPRVRQRGYARSRAGLLLRRRRKRNRRCAGAGRGLLHHGRNAPPRGARRAGQGMLHHRGRAL